MDKTLDEINSNAIKAVEAERNAAHAEAMTWRVRTLAVMGALVLVTMSLSWVIERLWVRSSARRCAVYILATQPGERDAKMVECGLVELEDIIADFHPHAGKIEIVNSKLQAGSIKITSGTSTWSTPGYITVDPNGRITGVR